MVWHMFPYLIASSDHTRGPHKPTDIHTKARASVFWPLNKPIMKMRVILGGGVSIAVWWSYIWGLRVCVCGYTVAPLIDLASVQVPLKQMPGDDIRAPQVTQLLLIFVAPSEHAPCVLSYFILFFILRGPGARRWYTAAVTTGQGCDEKQQQQRSIEEKGGRIFLFFLKKSLDAEFLYVSAQQWRRRVVSSSYSSPVCHWVEMSSRIKKESMWKALRSPEDRVMPK